MSDRFQSFVNKAFKGKDAVHLDIGTLVDILEAKGMESKDLIELVKEEVAALGLRVSAWAGRENIMVTLRKIPEVTAETEDAFLSAFGSANTSAGSDDDDIPPFK